MARIEVNCDRGVPDDDVADNGEMPFVDRSRQRHGTSVDEGIDARGKFDQQRGISGRHNSHVRHSAQRGRASRADKSFW
jgi:hypothetical protein